MKTVNIPPVGRISAWRVYDPFLPFDRWLYLRAEELRSICAARTERLAKRLGLVDFVATALREPIHRRG